MTGLFRALWFSERIDLFFSLSFLSCYGRKISAVTGEDRAVLYRPQGFQQIMMMSNNVVTCCQWDLRVVQTTTARWLRWIWNGGRLFWKIRHRRENIMKTGFFGVMGKWWWWIFAHERCIPNHRTRRISFYRVGCVSTFCVCLKFLEELVLTLWLLPSRR